MRYLLMAGLFLAACTGSPDDAQPGEDSSRPDGGQPVAACELLDDAEVADALGEDVAEGVDEDLDAGAVVLQTCQWSAETDPPVGLSVNVVGQESITTEESVEDIFEGVAEAAANPRAVDGVGDRAFVDEGQIHVLAGPYHLTVQAVGGELTESQLVELAELALARL